jgi:hypothetical protein
MIDFDDPCIWCQELDCDNCPYYRQLTEQEKIQNGESDPVIFTEDLSRSEAVK